MKKIECLTTAEERELLEHIDPDGFYRYLTGEIQEIKERKGHEFKKVRNMVIALLMLDAGLRVGEVVGLVNEDVFFMYRTVTKMTIRAEISKSGTPREVPLTERLRFALVRYRSGVKACKDENRQRRLIERSSLGGEMTTRGVEKIISNMGRSILGIRLYPHMLRHTCATKLMRFTDIRTLQIILGHKNLSSTQVYTHPNSNDVGMAIQRMESAGQPADQPEVQQSGGAMRLGDSPGDRFERRRGNTEGKTADLPGDNTVESEAKKSHLQVSSQQPG